MENILPKLQELIKTYGGTEVEQAFLALLAGKDLKTQANLYAKNISPEQIDQTLQQLDAGVSESLKNSDLRYQLLKEKLSLETEIKLTEADAFMNAGSDGKNVIVTVNGKQVILATESMKDHWRRNLTADLRRKLAKVSGDLEAISGHCQQIESANYGIRVKAELQSSIFRYLAG